MRVILAVALLACALGSGGCSSVKKKALRAEIAQIQERVAQKQALIEAQTTSAGSSQLGLDTRVSYSPIQKWTKTFNARPPAGRTVTFQQTSNGKIAKKDFDCGILGDGGWYVEFDTSTSTRANLEVVSLTFVASTNALTLTAPMDFEIKTKLHGHLDPCLGGGKGWRPRVEASKAWATVLGLQFGAMNGGKIPYALRLVSPNELSVTVQVDLGDIGTLGHPIKATGLARELMNGELSLVYSQGGEFGPLPDGTMRKYRIVTSNASFTTDANGLQVGTDVSIEIAPN